MNLTQIALRNDRVTWVAAFFVLLAGWFSYQSLPRAEDPGFIIRIAQVTTYFPGAGPERVEQLVTDKLEKAIQEIPELDFISSTSKTGVSIILVNIKERYRQMRPIWDKLRRKVEKARGELPEDVQGPFVDDEFGDVFGIVLSIIGDGFSYADIKNVADEVRNEVLHLPDVAKVDIYGAQEERVFVEYNNARLAELGLSPSHLSAILKGRNIIIPGGEITLGPERIVLEPTGNFESIADLRRTVIQIPGYAELLYLEDIADIYRGYVDPPTSKVTGSGQTAVALAIAMREGGNIIELGNQVSPLIKRLQKIYPWGIDFETVVYQPKDVEKKINDFVNNLLQAVAVVAAVLLLFLGLRTGLVVASLVPMAILMSLFIMYLLGIGLDQVSLASLIIALGMLVDNAIVMSESILVKMQVGKKSLIAAFESATELQVPLLTSSLTTAAAFLPIYLAESSTGEYTAPIFKVVTITLLCSWVISLTLVPLLATIFLKVKSTPQAVDRYRLYALYEVVLVKLLHHRWLTLSITATVFVVAMAGFQWVPKIFFPPSDRSFFKAEFELPVGTAFGATEQVVKDIETFMSAKLKVSAQRPQGVVNWASFIGQGAPRFVLPYNPEPPSPNYALLLINASSAAVVGEMIEKIEQFAAAKFPDLETSIRRIENGPPIASPVQVRVMGKESDELFTLVNETKEQLRVIAGIKNITDDWGRRTKKLLVRINQPRARRAGVTSQDIAISLQTGLSGLEMTQYREGDEIIPVLLRSVAADRMDIGKLESVNVYSQSSGHSVSLKQVADIEVQWQPAKILRRNRLRTVTVSADVYPGVTATQVNNSLVPWLEQKFDAAGLGYRYELGGEAETSGQANQSIIEKLPFAAFIILILLVAQFNSIRRTLIILLTIPLGVIGVVAGLLLAQSYFGFMTLLGIISLAGIVINNAIVLLEQIKIELADGVSHQQAIVKAAQRRARPILLTTATTVLGLLPLWIGGGAMWEPMAITIIFGLLFATLLTLGIVPVLYAVLFRVRSDNIG